MILSIDSGQNYGWGLYQLGVIAAGGGLFACGVTKNAEDLPNIRTHPITRVVLEVPHGGHGIASRANLVKLSRRVEAALDATGIKSLGHQMSRVREYQPIQWRHGVSKKQIMTKRILTRWMTIAEIHVLVKAQQENKIGATVIHNAIDAIGMGINECALEGWRELVQPDPPPWERQARYEALRMLDVKDLVLDPSLPAV